MTRENTANRDSCRLQKIRLVRPHPFEIGPLPDFQQRRYLEHLWGQSRAEFFAGKRIDDHTVAVDPFDGVGDSRAENGSRYTTNGIDYGLDILRIHSGRAASWTATTSAPACAA